MSHVQLRPRAPLAPGARGLVARLDRLDRTPYALAVTALLLAVLVVRLWSVSRWTWVDDDWIYLERAGSTGLGPYLVQNYNGHLMPGEFLVMWLLTRLAPLAFLPAVVLVALTAVGSAALWCRALAELVGPRLRVPALVALMTLSPLLLRPTMWFASALQVLPLQLSTALVVLFAARVARGGQRGDHVGLVLSFVLGLLFWQKALLLLVPITAVLVFTSGDRFRVAVRRHVGVVAVLGVVTAAYLALYLRLTAVDPGQRDMRASLAADRSVTDAVTVFARAAGDLLLPGLLGGPWGTMPVEGDKGARPPLVVLLLSAVVVAAAVAVLAARRRRAWQPLAMVVVHAAVSWSLVLFSNRFDMLGPEAINDERYHADVLTVAVLALAMLSTATLAEDPTRVWRRPWPAWSRSGRLHAAAAGVLVLSLLVGNVTALVRIGTHPGKAWLAHVRSTLPEGQVDLVDAYAPDDVLSAAFWARSARVSAMLAPLGDRLDFAGTGSPLHVVAPDGRVRTARVDPAVRGVPGPVAGCGYAVGPATPSRVPLTGELFDYDWAVQVDTVAGSAGRLVVELDGQDLEVEVPRGLGAAQVAFTGPVTEVVLRVPDGEPTLCVAGLVVGPVRPAG